MFWTRMSPARVQALFSIFIRNMIDQKKTDSVTMGDLIRAGVHFSVRLAIVRWIEREMGVQVFDVERKLG